MEKDIEFIVNVEKRTVVCKMWCDVHTAMRRIYKYVDNGTACLSNNRNIGMFVGIAKCAPEDEFDIEFGKKLALTRAKEKRCKAINEIIRRYLRVQRARLDALEKYGIHDAPNPKELYKDEV